MYRNPLSGGFQQKLVLLPLFALLSLLPSHKKNSWKSYVLSRLRFAWFSNSLPTRKAFSDQERTRFKEIEAEKKAEEQKIQELLAKQVFWVVLFFLNVQKREEQTKLKEFKKVTLAEFKKQAKREGLPFGKEAEEIRIREFTDSLHSTFQTERSTLDTLLEAESFRKQVVNSWFCILFCRLFIWLDFVKFQMHN